MLKSVRFETFMTGPAEPGRAWVATGPPEFPRLNKVRLSQVDRSDQGLIVLAPQIFVPSASPAMLFLLLAISSLNTSYQNFLFIQV